MKKIAITFLFGFVAMASMAQEKPGAVTVVPRVGVTIANLTNNDLVLASNDASLSSKSKAGFVAGADVYWQLTPTVALSAGVCYTSLGSKYDNYDLLREKPAETDEEIKYTAYTDNYTTLNYVAVPVMAHLYVANGLALKAGLQYGMLTGVKNAYTTCDFVQNRTTGVRTYQTAVENTNTSKEGYCKTDFSIPVGISYEYMKVVLEARYCFGLTKVNRELNSHNRAFTFTVGYRL